MSRVLLILTLWLLDHSLFSQHFVCVKLDDIDSLSYYQLVHSTTASTAKEYNYVEFSYRSKPVKLGSANSHVKLYTAHDSALHFEISAKIPLAGQYARVELYTLVLSREAANLKFNYILFSPFFNSKMSNQIIQEFIASKPMSKDTETLSEADVSEILCTMYSLFLALLSNEDSRDLMKDFATKYPLVKAGTYSQQYNECLQLLAQYHFWRNNFR